eukprot:CAMPEP_0206228122 /NCGR_PEP_ID=MMETSP0047_2-20121206/9000_1 /ASSEMBLY_ACC=CAM_ASM_000192 /TAXON_ID=195065 /ORGANISM="Chroomonas mesostigmatica_cf, Strain CCMP1168" /LENGTH=840 /DNA_ID=CAMNT_0053651343 /DNA_START=19 /DNA_END=2541 /DNA_ORIENTATION=-
MAMSTGTFDAGDLASVTSPSVAEGARPGGRKNSFDTDSVVHPLVHEAWRMGGLSLEELRKRTSGYGDGFKARDDTLIPLLIDSMVPMEKIYAEYKIPTGAVRELLGMVPPCYSYIEIWPVAFKSYNLMVPNFFNVPFTQIRLGPGGSRQAADLQGAAMFAVSKAAECSYCTAHACSYALRRGAAPELLENGWKAVGGKVSDDERLLGKQQHDPLEKSWSDGGGTIGEAERATFAVARCLGQVPCKLTDKVRQMLIDTVGEKVCEVLVMSMCGMGFLNKFMDGLGTQLEQVVFLETRDFVGEDINPLNYKVNPMLDPNMASSCPPKDTLWSKLRFASKVPGAIRYEMKQTKGIPNTWPAVGEHLRAAIGYDFPFLSALKSKTFLCKRVTLALTTVLIDNYDPKLSVVTIPIKILAGAVFATVSKSYILVEQFQQLAEIFNIDPEVMQSARELAGLSPAGLGGDTEMLPSGLKSLDYSSQCLLLLARAIAGSPCEVTEDLVSTMAAAKIPAECVVELVCFVSVAQLQLRLVTFYPHKVVPAGWMPPAHASRTMGTSQSNRTLIPQSTIQGGSPRQVPLAPASGGPLRAGAAYGGSPPPAGSFQGGYRGGGKEQSQSQQLWAHIGNSQPVSPMSQQSLQLSRHAHTHDGTWDPHLHLGSPPAFQYGYHQAPQYWHHQAPQNRHHQAPESVYSQGNLLQPQSVYSNAYSINTPYNEVQPPPRTTAPNSNPYSSNLSGNTTLSSQATWLHGSSQQGSSPKSRYGLVGAQPSRNDKVPWEKQVQEAELAGGFVEWIERPAIWPSGAPSERSAEPGRAVGWFGLYSQYGASNCGGQSEYDVSHYGAA